MSRRPTPLRTEAARALADRAHGAAGPVYLTVGEVLAIEIEQSRITVERIRGRLREIRRDVPFTHYTLPAVDDILDEVARAPRPEVGEG